MWVAADIAAVTLVGGSLWWSWLNVVPIVDIPAPPPLPSPNAFDTFATASGMIVNADPIDAANGRRNQLPRERNGVPYSDAEKAAAVAANAEALAALQVGFSQQYRHPTRRSFDALYPELAQFRKMARLLNLEGQVREASGDFDGAAQSRLDAMQLGIEAPRGGLLIHYLVGVACEKIGIQPLWELTGKLSADEARVAARRLEEINGRRVPLADALLEEKWAMQAGMLKAFQNGSTLEFARGMYTSAGDYASAVPRTSAALLLPLMTTSKSRIITNHSSYMDSIIERAGLPYTVASRTPRRPVPVDPINSLLLPVFDGVTIREADMKMQNSLLTAVLALRAYQAEHGAYPEDLNALVSDGYLTRVPADPFSETGDALLQYRRLENGKYLLYSVGPDGKDDGGSPVNDTVTGGRSKNWLEADMKGDFVIGVNNVRTEKSPGA
jgi:hypothetical protein